MTMSQVESILKMFHHEIGHEDNFVNCRQGQTAELVLPDDIQQGADLKTL